MLPSAPAAIPPSRPVESVTTNSVTSPVVVMRPTDFVPVSVNQRPPGPAVIATRSFPAGSGNSVTVPVGVMRPVFAFLPLSVNQRLPSGPVAMSDGRAATSPTGNSVKVPSGVRRPIFWASVNQTLPSGPFVMPPGAAPAGTMKYVTRPLGVTRPIRLLAATENQTFPSEPAVMSPGISEVSKIVSTPAGVARPTPPSTGVVLDFD